MASDAPRAASPALGIAVMISGMIILASSDAMAKHLTAGIAVIQILWVRYLIFSVLGAAMVLRRPAGDRLRVRRPILQIIRALTLTAANFFFVTALSLMQMADAHSVMAIAPLMITAASAPLLGEAVGARRWIAVAVGFAGMLVILRPGFGVFDPASLAPLCSAVCFSAYTLLTKVISRTDPPEPTLFYTGAIGLAALSLAVPFHWTDPQPMDWFWLAGAGVTGTLAHVCIILSLHYAPASTLQPFNYMMLVWATVLGYLVFHDLPDLWTTTGALVIVASGLYAWRHERLSIAAGANARLAA